MSINVEVKAMRIAILLAIFPILASQAANADVRHRSFPNAVQGTWASKAELCQADGKSNIVITESSVVGPNNSCAVEYVVESATPSGPIYSGHGSCLNRTEPGNKSAMNLVIRPRSDDRILIGTNLDTLAEYQRCDKAP